MFENITESLRRALSIFNKYGKLTPEVVDEALKEVRRALLAADVNYRAAKHLVERIREKATEQSVLETLTPYQTMIKIVRDELTEFLGGQAQEPDYTQFSRPVKILLTGLQGSGKTTTSIKLSLYLRKNRAMENVAVVACDVVRPAAVEQLKQLGAVNNIPVISLDGATSVEVARHAIEKAGNYDALVFDSQGRLHIDEEMMSELRQLYEVIRPDITFLVIDSMIGQEALNVAESFDKTAPVDGLILTKLDGDARGGAALSARYITGKMPVYAGVGEKVDDFQLYEPKRMAERILGMGDVLTLIEKAEKTVDRKKAEEAQRKLLSGSFTLEDYLEQIKEVKKMGDFASLIEQLPYELRSNLPDTFDDRMIKRTEAIILSMTPEERANPAIIDGSRRIRIAAGSGTTVQDVNQLLKSYYEMKKMFKSLKKGKKKRKFPFPF